MGKFCTHCGKELVDDAVFCPGCGCKADSAYTRSNTPTPTTTTENKTSVAFILGIVGIVSAWLFALVGHITSIIGIILGIKEYQSTGKMTGLTLSIIGEVCSIFSSIIGAVAVSSLF